MNLQEPRDFEPAAFKPVRFIMVVLLITVFISQAIQWYSQSVSLPRYCDDPEAALQYLEKIVSHPTPAGDEAKKPYIIAAKLIFLVPRQSDEPVPDYIQRVRIYLRQQCLR